MARLNSDGKLAALLLGALLIAYSWPRDHDLGPNINAHLSQALAIVFDGTLAIDGYATSSFTYTIDWALAPDGHLYPAKAPGCALVLTPVVWLVTAVERRLGIDPLSGGAIWRKAVIGNWLLNAWPSAVCMLLLFRLTRELGVSPAPAFAGTVTVALGTAYFPFATAFYAHAPAANLLILATLAIFGKAAPPWIDVAAGMAAGCAVIFDYQASIAVITCGVSLVWLRPRAIFRFVAGGVIPLVVLLGYHEATLGSPQATPYDFQNPVFTSAVSGRFGSPDPRILAALLFSPYRGLLFYSPAVAAAIPGAAGLWRGAIGSAGEDVRRRQTYVLFSIATLAAWLLLNSSYFTWHGGHTTGPRFIIPAIVLIGPLIACGFSRFPRLTGSLLAVSMLTQLAIATVWLRVPDSYLNPLLDVIYPRFFAADFVRANLGMRLGLQGLWSVIPVVMGIAAALLGAWRVIRSTPGAGGEVRNRGRA